MVEHLLPSLPPVPSNLPPTPGAGVSLSPPRPTRHPAANAGSAGARGREPAGGRSRLSRSVARSTLQNAANHGFRRVSTLEAPASDRLSVQPIFREDSGPRFRAASPVPRRAAPTVRDPGRPDRSPGLLAVWGSGRVSGRSRPAEPWHHCCGSEAVAAGWRCRTTTLVAAERDAIA